jgi:aconitate hydratase
MMRGTFANVRIRNLMLPVDAEGHRQEGGYTLLDGQQTTVFAAAMSYIERGTPTIVVAGEEYGTGSSRDWAAKGTRLLGVRAVIARSYERIHRANLVGMGVLPLQFIGDDSALRSPCVVTKPSTSSVSMLGDACRCRSSSWSSNGQTAARVERPLLCRIDTPIEVSYYCSCGKGWHPARPPQKRSRGRRRLPARPSFSERRFSGNQRTPRSGGKRSGLG